MDVEAVAAELLAALEALRIEDVWDQTGATCFFSVEPAQAADRLVEALVMPYETRIRRAAQEGRPEEATLLMQGVLLALRRFEQESEAPFRAWVLDLEATYAPRLQKASIGEHG